MIACRIVRPSIAPEKLLRDRLLEGEVAQAFFEAVLRQARERQLLSNEHFTVDGTLIEAWAGLKSFRHPGRQGSGDSDDDPGNPTLNFRGEKRSNETHASTTDPEALLARIQGRESKLAYRGHLLTENRHGLGVDARRTPADGFAERRAALAMLERIPGQQRVTLGADRGYDVRAFVAELRPLHGTPHVAQNTTRQSSSIDGRTTRHAGYAASQRRRKRVEEVFGWMKTIGPLRKTKYRGRERVGWMFVFAAPAYNLVRMRTLMAATP